MVSSGMFLALNEIGDFRVVGAASVFLFLSVLMISIFSFVSIEAWAEARRKEREAYYKSETMRRIVEAPGEGARYVIEIMREEERIRQMNQRAEEVKIVQGMKIGGVVTIAVGFALMIFFYFIIDRSGKPVYVLGVFPVLIGIALLISVNFMHPKASIE
jgi:mannose/fructose/N-acetylgalactosamine-specific phosphotransferase system component IIC